MGVVLRKTLWAGLALTACAATFSLYLNPHFALDVATRVWACF
jgi:hypothetical protein